MESIKGPTVPGVLTKQILGYEVPVVPTRADDRYYEMMRKIDVSLQVYLIDHPDMFMVHIEALDCRSGQLHGYTGDNVSEGMDKIMESLKQFRS